MKKGIISKNNSTAMMKAKASSGSLKPVKPSAPGATKKTPRSGVQVVPSNKQKLKQKQNLKQQKNIVYDDYLTKTLLEGSLGRDTR